MLLWYKETDAHKRIPSYIKSIPMTSKGIQNELGRNKVFEAIS